MKKPNDKVDADGSRYCFRSVRECSDEPVAGFWIAKLECGHAAQVEDRSGIPGLEDLGRPLGVRCEECEVE